MTDKENLSDSKVKVLGAISPWRAFGYSPEFVSHRAKNAKRFLILA